MRVLGLTAALALIALPVLAQDATGDAEAGETVFNRNCVACHVVRDDAGEVLAGRNARTGPNLYGMPGRVPGTVADFAYSDPLVAFGATGAVWDETHFVGFVMDPTDYLRAELDDDSARAKMAFQLRNEEDALNVWAYLVSLSAAPAE